VNILAWSILFGIPAAPKRQVHAPSVPWSPGVAAIGKDSVALHFGREPVAIGIAAEPVAAVDASRTYKSLVDGDNLPVFPGLGLSRAYVNIFACRCKRLGGPLTIRVFATALLPVVRARPQMYLSTVVPCVCVVEAELLLASGTKAFRRWVILPLPVGVHLLGIIALPHVHLSAVMKVLSMVETLSLHTF